MAQAVTLGIADRVRFVGRVAGDDKWRLLARARVVAMPSRFETFGMVAVEALACGTPVVAFDIDCLRAVVPTGCGTHAVPAFDVDAYAVALRELFGDPAALGTARVRGIDFAHGFDWDVIARAAGAGLSLVAGPGG